MASILEVNMLWPCGRKKLVNTMVWISSRPTTSKESVVSSFSDLCKSEKAPSKAKAV